MIDAYELLKQGKSIDEINEIIAAELNAANTKLAEEEEAAAAEAKKKETIDSARKDAVAALTEYFALVNPSVTEKLITSVLSTLESIKLKSAKNGTAVWESSVLPGWLDIFDIFTR